MQSQPRPLERGADRVGFARDVLLDPVLRSRLDLAFELDADPLHVDRRPEFLALAGAVLLERIGDLDTIGDEHDFPSVGLGR